MNPYEILGIPINSSLDEVKRIYKIIALKSHPDKLNNISDINERNKKIKEFIEATNAYNKILKGDSNDFNDFKDFNNFDSNDFNDYKFTYEDWEQTFNTIRHSELMKKIVTMFIKSKIKKHQINVDIKYSDYFNNGKKKLRLFLKNVEEPVYINLNCKQYPLCIINYIDDNDNEHEISIQMNLINDKEINNNYYHKIDDNNNDNNNNSNQKTSINIYYDLNIDIIDYLIGGEKEILFVNKEIIKIIIEPFTEMIIINNYGINKGSLIINYKFDKPINKENWDKLNNADKIEMIRILEKIKNDIKK